MMTKIKNLFVIIFLLFISACSTGIIYAPVTEVSTIEPMPKKGFYKVQHDDTLYSIAWRYGLDYRTLADINHIARPYHIEMGQVIYLRPANREVPVSQPVFEPQPLLPMESSIQWHWPAQGRVVGEFGGLNKGINIQGHFGEPIYTAAPGKVVYSGDGLRAYGNLIIIKHNNVFLSAYAYNSKVLVKEGQFVRSGQKISEMGSADGRRAILHFEIRASGKPVNPLNYLVK